MDHLQPDKRAVPKTTAAKPFPKDISEDLRNSLLDRSVTNPDTGCRVWLGAVNNKGYGVVWVPRDKKIRLAHRVALGVERDTSGLVVDHLCRNRRCIQPAHLELVTMALNTQRGNRVLLRESAQFCKRGHDFTITATWNANGYRECMECKRLSNAKKV